MEDKDPYTRPSNLWARGRQAGRREVVEWIQSHPGKDKHTWEEWFEWQDKLIEWGIKKTK